MANDVNSIPKDKIKPPTTAMSLVDFRRHIVSTKGDINIDIDQLNAPSHSEIKNLILI